MQNMSKGSTLSKQNLENNKNHKAIFLTENDVAKLRHLKIENWDNVSDIWALKLGIPILAMSNVASNLFINSLYRSKFLLIASKHTASFVSSIILTGFVSTAASAAVLHVSFYEKMLKSSTKDDCMLCAEIQGMATHLAIGSLVPTGLAWLTSFYHASLYYTVRIPNLESYFKAGKKREYFRQIGNVFRKTNKNVLGLLTTCYSLQILFASCVMFFQRKQFMEHIEPLKFTIADINRIKPGRI